MAIVLEHLPAIMGDVARELLGEPNRAMSSAKDLRFGSHGSMSVDLEKGTFFDHEAQQGGGVLDLIKREKRIEGREREEWIAERWPDVVENRPRANGKNGHHQPAAREKLGKAVAFYDYVDETGHLLFQVVRFEPKTFRQRRRARPDDPPHMIRDGWVYTVRGSRQVPYQLPDLIEAIGSGRPVFVVEGEKDADNWRRLGVPCTCNAGGTGKWSDELSHYFQDADVVVIQDNDPQARKKDGTLLFHDDGRPKYPGQDHAWAVCESLSNVTARVRLLDLKVAWPALPSKGDSSDWIENGAKAEQLYEIAERAPDWSPELPRPEPERNLPALPIIHLPAWDGQPVPERQWIVRNRVPARNVTLLSGDGGVGKTLLLQQLAVATVLGLDWLGEMPKQGPVMLVSAEDDDDEIHVRLSSIVQHYGASFRDLADLEIISLAGKEAAFAVTGNHGIVKPTDLFEAIRIQARKLRPAWIGIDTAADVFVVEERDRSQVRQCISLLRGLAMEINAGVILLSHPSLSGLNSGSGLSGSTAWNNSVRSRLYLHMPDDDDDDDVSDRNVRILELMKSNYAVAGEQMRLRWENGLLRPEAGQLVPMASNLNKIDAEARAAKLFCGLLEYHNMNDMPVSPSATARNGAPAVFSAMPEAAELHPKDRKRKQILRNAMHTLIKAGEVKIGKGPRCEKPSKQHPCLYITRLHPDTDPQGQLRL